MCKREGCRWSEGARQQTHGSVLRKAWHHESNSCQQPGRHRKRMSTACVFHRMWGYAATSCVARAGDSRSAWLMGTGRWCAGLTCWSSRSRRVPVAEPHAGSGQGCESAVRREKCWRRAGRLNAPPASMERPGLQRGQSRYIVELLCPVVGREVVQPSSRRRHRA